MRVQRALLGLLVDPVNNGLEVLVASFASE
jgi:hypothetical protein